MKKYQVQTSESYNQRWVVEAGSEADAESLVSMGGGVRCSELELVESRVDTFGGDEIDEGAYDDCLRMHKEHPRPYLDPDKPLGWMYRPGGKTTEGR